MPEVVKDKSSSLSTQSAKSILAKPLESNHEALKEKLSCHVLYCHLFCAMQPNCNWHTKKKNSTASSELMTKHVQINNDHNVNNPKLKLIAMG